MSFLRAAGFVGFVLVACGGDVFNSGGDASGPANDGSTSSDGGDGGLCSYAEHRSSDDRACAADTDCTYVLHTLNCCQAQNEGLRADRAVTFNANEMAQQKGCKCLTGCAAQTIDDLQKAGSNFKASCDNHVCTSHAQ